MNRSQIENGFQIFQSAIPSPLLERLREEAVRLSRVFDSGNLRQVCSHSDCFSALAKSAVIRDLLPDNQLQFVRSLFFNKTPEDNWPVAWHQDLTIAVRDKVEVSGYGPWSKKQDIVHVQPPIGLLKKMVTIRIHLDDTPAENGALKVIPGSHRYGKIPTPELREKFDLDTEAVSCDCEAGDVLVMSPLILHASNRSEKPANRRVIHFEYAALDDLDSELKWFEDC